jgi:uncharacterized protein YukE
MSYMLVELSTGNVVGFFPTEHEALQEVVEAITEDGVDAVETLGLGYNDPSGLVRRIADGAELAQRALAAFPAARLSPVSSTGKSVIGSARPRATTPAWVDPSELQRMSVALEQRARQLQEVLEGLSHQSHQIGASAWQGSAASRLLHDVQESQLHLEQARRALLEASIRLREEAAALAAATGAFKQ